MARLSFNLSELNVLLVDDDSFARDLELTALKTLGINDITVAISGEDGLLALESRGPFDMIVSDWNMPRFDGLQLLEIVRKRWPELTFLMATNNEGLDQINVAVEAGVDGYLIKPFSLDKLREMTHLALATRRGRNSKNGQVVVPKPQFVNDESNRNLKHVFSVISGILASADHSPHATDLSAKQTKQISELTEILTRQLAWFVQSLDSASAAHLKLIHLHVECIQAVQSGQLSLLEHETRNGILDGLNVAIDLVPR